MTEQNLTSPRTFSRLLLLVVIVSLIVSGSTRVVVHAAISVPETIRVALFISTGAAASTSTTPVATLQAPDGFNLVWRDPQVSIPISDVAAGQSVRVMMDSYRALILETTELNAAITVLKKIQATSSAAFITSLSKSGNTTYQVSEGAYATASQASTALTRWTNAAVATGVQTSLSARVAGPWAVESGPYASLAQANTAVKTIGSKGLDAFVAIKQQNGKLFYYVRVGQEQDAGALAAVKTSVIAAGGVNVTIPETDEPYALIRNDMTLNGASNKPVTLYAIPNGAGAVLRADPVADTGIQLTERSKRIYRGSMELSVYGNALAVINDVNLEQYLYSVVSAEVGSGWPSEAQKAQAVVARSYALASGMQYKIAHVVDTTVSQAYYGLGNENPNSTAGVDATQGEVLVNERGKVVSALFSANAGGITADSIEAWGNVDPSYASAVNSPDSGPLNGKMKWHRIVTTDGLMGYMREDLLESSGKKNEIGLAQLRIVQSGSNVRKKPTTDSESVAQLSAQSLVVSIGTVNETTAYSWIESFTAEQLLTTLSARDKTVTGPLTTLEVSKTGPSGRAIELKANGAKVDIKQPTQFNGALGGLRSNFFTIEQTGLLTILDDSNNKRQLPQQSGALNIIDGNDNVRTVNAGNLFILDKNGKLRAATADAQYTISGKGWGHGVGMSQWGARGFAEQGYDYQYILKYYYNNVNIEKGAVG
ncbi:MAG: SpoIID/LytB domain-containing protein [Candidatus Cohnella colombiensis]|uniref:SpoIID/LytB domain-containing protein n=1 Tax=Candidatus Cohnella colombiensis TaxID=3121368 RepID=A0AA95F0F8_9BACL|nr:MAG: SpoIID/LytB domain-containing protein [Cohnella sp.]